MELLALYLIRGCISFSPYHMIEHIVVEFGTEQDRVELQKYEKEFDECPPVYEPVSKDDHADLVVKVDSVYEEFTVKELRSFNADLVEYFVFHHKVFYASVKWKRGVYIRLTCGDYQFISKDCNL